MEEYGENNEHEALNIKKIKEILSKQNIKLSIRGCGCCDSPVVTFEYKGEKIIEDAGIFNIDMFSDAKKNVTTNHNDDDF